MQDASHRIQRLEADNRELREQVDGMKNMMNMLLMTDVSPLALSMKRSLATMVAPDTGSSSSRSVRIRLEGDESNFNAGDPMPPPPPPPAPPPPPRLPSTPVPSSGPGLHGDSSRDPRLKQSPRGVYVAMTPPRGSRTESECVDGLSLMGIPSKAIYLEQGIKSPCSLANIFVPACCTMQDWTTRAVQRGLYDHRTGSSRHPRSWVCPFPGCYPMQS